MADSKIELRSEKVRHIIGEIPSKGGKTKCVNIIIG